MMQSHESLTTHVVTFDAKLLTYFTSLHKIEPIAEGNVTVVYVAYTPHSKKGEERKENEILTILFYWKNYLFEEIEETMHITKTYEKYTWLIASFIWFLPTS